MSGSNEFYTLLTNLGISEIVKARAGGTELRLSKMAVGSSKELISQELVSLRDEKYRFNINSITQDADNANYLVVEGVIPSSVGGFEISEVGIFTDTDKLFAIAKVPTSYKPLLSEGSAKDFTIRVIIEVSNSDNVALKVDESVVLATRNFVKGELKKYALVNGDETKVFKVATATEDNEAMNKAQINSLLEALKSSINSQLSSKANLTGSSSQKFQVATASNSYDAINKSLFDSTISSLRSSLSSQLSSKANLAGSSSQKFQVATASNSYDAINKSLFDSTISSLRSSLSSQISNNQAISSSSKSTNGYIKFQNGLIIQWGLDGTYDPFWEDEPKTIFFPINFPNRCFIVHLNMHTTYDRPFGGGYYAVSSWDRSSFVRANQMGRIAWISIGY